MAQVQLLRQWKHYRPDFVLTGVSDGVATILVKRKIGKIIEPVEVAEQPRPTLPAEVTQIGTGRKK